MPEGGASAVYEHGRPGCPPGLQARRRAVGLRPRPHPARWRLTQYAPLHLQVWHAGASRFEDRRGGNDFSIGIELEGSLGEARRFCRGKSRRTGSGTGFGCVRLDVYGRLSSGSLFGIGMSLPDGFTQDAYRHVDLRGSVFQSAHALPMFCAVPSGVADAVMLGSEPLFE